MTGLLIVDAQNGLFDSIQDVTAKREAMQGLLEATRNARRPALFTQDVDVGEAASKARKIHGSRAALESNRVLRHAAKHLDRSERLPKPLRGCSAPRALSRLTAMTDSQLEIRPVRVPDDFPALAWIANSVFDWHTTPEELALEAQNREARFHHAQFVAEVLEGDQKRVVGEVVVGHDRFSHEEDKYRVNVMVHPEYQARGIGGALWRTAWNHLQGLRPRKLVNMTNSDSERGLRLLEKLGFQQVWERVESRLDPKTVNWNAYTRLNEALETRGIAIRSLESLEDEDKLRKLYGFDRELMEDVPFGQAVTFPSFEQWFKEISSDPKFQPELIWLALKGDEWIGMSSLERLPDCFVIGMTGVKRDYRGLGVAKRLKLEGVRHALNHGGLEIRTFNDHVNTAMLEMNRHMGFKRFRSRLRFEKLL
jgi:mycothiol synthase